jgi:hypothetical protein
MRSASTFYATNSRSQVVTFIGDNPSSMFIAPIKLYLAHDRDTTALEVGLRTRLSAKNATSIGSFSSLCEFWEQSARCLNSVPGFGPRVLFVPAIEEAALGSIVRLWLFGDSICSDARRAGDGPVWDQQFG